MAGNNKRTTCTIILAVEKPVHSMILTSPFFFILPHNISTHYIQPNDTIISTQYFYHITPSPHHPVISSSISLILTIHCRSGSLSESKACSLQQRNICIVWFEGIHRIIIMSSSPLMPLMPLSSPPSSPPLLPSPPPLPSPPLPSPPPLPSATRPLLFLHYSSLARCLLITYR